MAQPEFPKIIARGSISVTIYEREFTKPDKQGKERRYLEYILTYYQDGKRKRETSADYFALKTRADEVLDDLDKGRTDGEALSAAQRDERARAVEAAKPTGQPLDVVASRYAKAYEIVGGDFVILAAQEYAKRHLNKIQPRTVTQAVDDMVAEKEEKKRSAVHVSRLRIHLDRFARAMPQLIASVTAPEIDLFLDGLKDDNGKKVGARTRDNHADSIVTLYRWAKLKRYVPSDYDETDRITRLDTDEDGEIEIYTPTEAAALLAKAPAELIPFLAIGAFAGLRSSEILRLDWADVRTENGDPHIVVQKGKVKKKGKSRRIVPMTENLKAWLKPHIKENGRVWPHSEPLLYKRLQDLAPAAEAGLREKDPKAKLEWRPNALRHSFISYRVASTKNVAQVALEAGNSPQIIFSAYRELVTEQDAGKWFVVAP